METGGAVGGEILSARERQVALAYAEGASHREIGVRLFIAPSTVRTHLGTIYRKLGVASKIELRRRMVEPASAQPPGAEAMPVSVIRRPGVAIMPFAVAGGHDDLADGLVQDVITRLAKLRSVRVTARGSVFALAARGLGGEDAARLLGVDYFATGSLRRRRGGVRVSVELAATTGAGILWADSFDLDRADAFPALDAIGDRIVAAVAGGIDDAERDRALLKHPDSLDAWESFHRGLWHMYRFTSPDNDAAQALFRRAAALDPTFARAHAGLSFTHFQNAFLLHPDERRQEVDLAIAAAGRSLEADGRDPSAHWAMGRARWLQGADAEAVAELATAVALSPHYGQGHYALAFVNSQSGDPHAALASVDISQALSPFDPLLFGMLGSRAMALFRLGAFEEAAEWAVKAAARPNAHIHILAIAANCLAVAGRVRDAQSLATEIRKAVPGYGVEHFFAAFRFPSEAQAIFRKGAGLIGMA